jgi:hypothetical protein
MTQGCNNIVIAWLYRTCWNNLAISLIMPSSLLQAYSKLVDNLRQAVRTQLVDGLLADLLQDVRFLRVWYFTRTNIEHTVFCNSEHFVKYWRGRIRLRKLPSLPLVSTTDWYKANTLSKSRRQRSSSSRDLRTQYSSEGLKMGFAYFCKDGKNGICMATHVSFSATSNCTRPLEIAFEKPTWIRKVSATPVRVEANDNI